MSTLLKSERLIALAKTYRNDVFSIDHRQPDSESFLGVSIATDTKNPNGIVIDSVKGFGFRVTLTDYFPESVESHGFKFGKIVKKTTRQIIYAQNDESGQVTVNKSENETALTTLGIDAESAATLVFKFYRRAIENKNPKRDDKDSQTHLMESYRSQQKAIRESR